MINKVDLLASEQSGSSLPMEKLGSLLDILVICAPICVLAYGSPLLGAGSNLNAMLIHLGYLLMMVVGWCVLRMRGSGWREIAFARPES